MQGSSRNQFTSRWTNCSPQAGPMTAENESVIFIRASQARLEYIFCHSALPFFCISLPTHGQFTLPRSRVFSGEIKLESDQA